MKRAPIKKDAVKVMSAVLTVSMALSFAACGKKDTGKETGSASGKGGTEEVLSGSKISADSPWFDSTMNEIIPAVNTGRKMASAPFSRLSGADDKYIVALTTGDYDIPANFNWENYRYSDFAIVTLSVVDRNTKQVKNTIDLIGMFSEASCIEKVLYRNGKISVYYTIYDPYTNTAVYREAELDPSTGDILNEKDISGYSLPDRTFDIGDYLVETGMIWEEVSYFKLIITSSDGERKEVVINDNNSDLYDIPLILPVDGSKALVPCEGKNGMIYYTVDLETGALTSENAKDYEWLDLSYKSSSFTGSDGNVYFLTTSGIERIDMKNRSVDKIFDFSWCGINRSSLSDLEIADCTGDSILLCGASPTSRPYGDPDHSAFSIIDLKKAENPHAGKTVLELYVPYGYVDESIADAILKYNEMSTDYHIEVSNRYKESDYYDDTQYIDSDDDSDLVNLTGSQKMSNALAMDILNGEGPDILLDTSAFGQLNNPAYLADLTPYIGDLDPDRYFTSIIAGAKTDGALYQLPICFSVAGIQTDPKNAGSSGTGFTTAEYAEFLDGALNGKDIITYGQAHYFAKLFNLSADMFIKDGKADFSDPAFIELAEFVKDHVQQNSTSWSDIENGDVNGPVAEVAENVVIYKGMFSRDRVTPGKEEAFNIDCYGMSSYIRGVVSGKTFTAILGFPSSDGRGPVYKPIVSVAISAQAENTEACAEFVKMLLSDEVQIPLAMNDDFVISRDAFRQGGRAAVEYYNGDGAVILFGYDPAAGGAVNTGIVFSDKNIDDMENIILSCSKMDTADAAIDLILIEEMPAYFTGQKDLASVTAIAQDRVQKVLDERN